MRRLYALAGLAESTNPKVAELEAKITALKERIAEAEKKMSWSQNAIRAAHEGWQRDRFGGVGQGRYQAYVAEHESIVAEQAGLVNSLNSQINDAQNDIAKLAELDAKKAAEAEVEKAKAPAAQADSDRAEVSRFQRQQALYFMPGRYDFGAGSAARNSYYKGVGESMSHLLHMNRPTMGFDVWGAVAQGFAKGVQQARAEGVKVDLPKLPGVSAPKVQLPSWLKQFAKPAKIVGQNVVRSVRTAQEKDRAEAAARAAAVGSSTISAEPQGQVEGASWAKPALALAGIAALIIVARKA